MKTTMKLVFSRGMIAGLVAIAAGSASYGQVALTLTTSEPNPVAGGQFFTYTITATNNGLTGPMTLNDALPAGVQFLSVSTSSPLLAARPVCSGPASGSNGSVTCSHPSFPAGAVATITIRAQVAPDASGVVDNVVDVAPAGSERVTFLQHIKGDAPFQLFINASPQVSPGETVAYLIQVVNTGNSTGQVIVEDVLPDSTSFVSVSATGTLHDACTFQAALNKLLCFGSVPTGTSAITLLLKVADGAKPGSITNTATMHVNFPTFGDFQASASTTVLKK